MSNPMKPATPEQRHHGVACTTARDFRWERGDIKSISLLGNVLARQMSADHGAAETIMFRDGAHGGPWLTEAAACNVWIVHEGALLGPPKSEHVLEGIRYDLLRELCEEVGIAYSAMEPKAALRAGEMQRRYRQRGGSRSRTVADFLIGAHAMMQCDSLITRDAGFYRDYFKGLKVIVPKG